MSDSRFNPVKANGMTSFVLPRLLAAFLCCRKACNLQNLGNCSAHGDDWNCIIMPEAFKLPQFN